MTNSSVGPSIGTVTFVNRIQLDAPSSSDDS